MSFKLVIALFGVNVSCCTLGKLLSVTSNCVMYVSCSVAVQGHQLLLTSLVLPMHKTKDVTAHITKNVILHHTLTPVRTIRLHQLRSIALTGG